MRMVVQRELRATSRRWFTFWARTIAAGIALWIVASNSNVFLSGRQLFSSTISLAFVACIIEGIRRAGSSIAEEKAEGTYGLVLMTNLTGAELLFGKFWVIYLSSLQGALAVTPALAIAILLGGVSGVELIMSVIALLHTLAIAIGIGLCVSAVSLTPAVAMFRSLLILGAGAFLGLFFLSGSPNREYNPLAYLNPMYPIFWDIRTDKFGGYWMALVSSQVMLYLLLKNRGGALATHFRREQEREVQRRRPLDAPPELVVESNAHLAPQWFSHSPVEWLTLREMAMHTGRWYLLGWSAVVALFILIGKEGGLVLALLLAIIFAFWISIASSRTFALLRQWQLFEVLLTTPLGADGIIAGHLTALRRVFYWPSVMVCVSTFVVLVRLALPEPGEFFGGFIVLFGFMALMWSAPWIGMWAGLATKTPARAAIWTTALVILVPRLACIYMVDLIYFIVAKPLAKNAIDRRLQQLRGE